MFFPDCESSMVGQTHYDGGVYEDHTFHRGSRDDGTYESKTWRFRDTVRRVVFDMPDGTELVYTRPYDGVSFRRVRWEDDKTRLVNKLGAQIRNRIWEYLGGKRFKRVRL